MGMKFDMANEDRKSPMEMVRQDLVQQLLTVHGESLRLTSPARVCGLMDCDRKTLDGLGLPRVTLTPGH